MAFGSASSELRALTQAERQQLKANARRRRRSFRLSPDDAPSRRAMSDAEPALATATLLAQGGGGGAIVPSINPATTYARDRDTYAPIDGRIYSRDHCPNYELPEQTLAALEGAQGCLLFSSGIAAADALLRALLRPGDCLVLPRLGYFAIRKHAAARTCPPLELGRTDLQTG